MSRCWQERENLQAATIRGDLRGIPPKPPACARVAPQAFAWIAPPGCQSSTAPGIGQRLGDQAVEPQDCIALVTGPRDADATSPRGAIACLHQAREAVRLLLSVGRDNLTVPRKPLAAQVARGFHFVRQKKAPAGGAGARLLEGRQKTRDSLGGRPRSVKVGAWGQMGARH